MISFSPHRILVSAFSAFIYGVCFSFLYSLIMSLERSFFLMFSNKHTSAKTPLNVGDLHGNTGIQCFMIFTYGIGFAILSYLTLDGVLRLYMLLLSLFGFFVTQKLFLNKLALLFCKFNIKIMDIIPTFLSKIMKICITRTKNMRNNQIND